MINQLPRTIWGCYGGLKLYLLACGWCKRALSWLCSPPRLPHVWGNSELTARWPCSPVYSRVTLVNCLKKRFHHDWLCRERLEKGGGKKMWFYYCECVQYMRGAQGRIVRNGKLRKRRGNISKNIFLLFHRLPGPGASRKPRKMLFFAFILLFFPGIRLSPPVAPTKGYIFICPSCARR